MEGDRTTMLEVIALRERVSGRHFDVVQFPLEPTEEAARKGMFLPYLDYLVATGKSAAEEGQSANKYFPDWNPESVSKYFDHPVVYPYEFVR